MDRDIQRELRHLSRYILNLSHTLGNTNSTLEDIMVVSECLGIAKDVTDQYIEIQRRRDNGEDV